MGGGKCRPRASLEFGTSFSCRKHPSSSPVGICPKCLRERLLSLVCSHCGERRLSSCTCSDLSPRRSSSSSSAAADAAVEVGSVGRISFLIHNDIPLSPSFENNSGEPRRSSASRLLRALFRLKETPASASSPGEQRTSSASVEGGGGGEDVEWGQKRFLGGGGDPFWSAGKRVFSVREEEFRAGGDSEFIDFRFDSAGVFCRNFEQKSSSAGAGLGSDRSGGDGGGGKGVRVWRRWAMTNKKKKKECGEEIKV